MPKFKMFIPAIWVMAPILWGLSVLILLLLPISDACARSKTGIGDEKRVESIHSLKSPLPNAQLRVHRMSDVRMTMTNWGLIGSQTRDLNESVYGCFNPHPEEEWPAPSFEYPPGSGIEYLFQGAIWIGAKIDDTVYTSVGCDGWFWIYELWPDGPEPQGYINERSIIPTAQCYSPDAISDHDIIAVYTDTSADIPLSPSQQDPWDNRKHHPLDVRVTQKSYSWDTEGYDKFIIAEYTIENIGAQLLSEVRIGFYMDADIMHIDENPYGAFGAWDDITGFLENYEVSPGDTREVNIVWAADNDGHGIGGEVTWTEFSPRSVLGMKILYTSNPDLQISYNWWVSHWAGYPKDWGPWKLESQEEWAEWNTCYPEFPNTFPDNVLGTPGGDCSKYFLMSNQEIDYDQIFTCTWPDDHPEQGWLPPSPECEDIGNGYDTRFLFSFGQFDQIAPGDSLTFAVAYVIGESLHVDPLNLYHDPNMTNPDAYYANLYFADLVNNALMAESLYHDLLVNDPPGIPNIPSGPAEGEPGIEYDFSSATTDPEEDDILYLFDWGDGTDSDWLGPYNSGETCTVSHAWMNSGTSYVKVKAKDTYDHGSDWSDSLSIAIYIQGDADGDGLVGPADVLHIIKYLYKGGPAPDPLKAGDANCDGNIDLGDALHLINYLYKGGPAPCE